MKIYRMNEFDCVIAETEDEAVAWYWNEYPWPGDIEYPIQEVSEDMALPCDEVLDSREPIPEIQWPDQPPLLIRILDEKKEEEEEG